MPARQYWVSGLDDNLEEEGEMAETALIEDPARTSKQGKGIKTGTPPPPHLHPFAQKRQQRVRSEDT